ncbi:MAG: S8 family serine peptidase [Candidatus Promineifilaceae bacterium]
MKQSNNRKILILFMFILLFCSMTLFISGPTDRGNSSNSLLTANVAYAEKIDPAVLKELQSSPDGKVSILAMLTEQADLTEASQIRDWDARGWAVYNALQETASQTQAPVLSALSSLQRSGEVENVTTFWIVNLISIRTNENGLRTLAAMPEIESIMVQPKLEPPEVIVDDNLTPEVSPEWGITKIGAPDVWSTYGITGTGAVAANVDTGVDYTHPALVDNYRGNLGGGSFDHNYNWYDPTGVAAVPTDNNGHGTHTMGTEIGDDGGANQIGVAPGAKWIAAFGCCPTNDALLEAQEFMLAPTDLAGNNPNPSLRPDVLNQSWGGYGASPIYNQVIDNLRAAGIFPSFSAGNNGSQCGTLGSPGDSPYAFNVGATDINDNIASFSARGPNPVTMQTGPNVSAPGSNVRSSIPGGGYANFSGTSMASPHVAGSVALLISLEPKLRGQVDQLEELLRKTAVPMTSGQTCGGVSGSETPNNTFGWGRIDVKAAADMMWQAGIISGTVTSSGSPVPDVTVTYSRLGYTLTTQTDSSGQYYVVAGAGSWDLTASAYGYQPDSASGVAVTQNMTTTQDFNLPALAQHTVSGTVTDDVTGEGVPALVSVVGEPLAASVMADNNGDYSIVVPDGSHQIQAEHPGFDSQTQTVNVSGNQTLDFDLSSRINYACFDNQAGYSLYDWIDATGGTAYNLGDDASTVPITLSPPFTYFGQSYNSVRVNSNGFLYFGSTTYNIPLMYLPFEGPPNNDVMGLGEDLNPANGSQGVIYTLQTGNLFVAQYKDVEHWASGFPETFEMILNLDTGEIKVQYQSLSWPDPTTVGLENSDGSVGKMYSYNNSANLVNGRAVQFTPASGSAVNWGCTDQVTDLSLSMTDTPDPVTTGEQLTYTLTISNSGPLTATQVTVEDTLPGSVSFDSATSSSGSCNESSGVVTCALDDMSGSETTTVTIVVTVNQDGTLENNASVSMAELDANIGNNDASESTQAGAATNSIYLPVVLKP